MKTNTVGEIIKNEKAVELMTPRGFIHLNHRRQITRFVSYI